MTAHRFFLGVAVVVGLASVTTPAQEQTAAELLPRSTALYAEVGEPQALLKLILEHPLLERLKSVDAYDELLRGKDFRQLRTAVRMVETELDMSWYELLGSVTQGGLFMALDAESEGLALLAKTNDPQTTEKLRDVLLTVVRGLSQAQGKPDPVETQEYRGVHVDALNDIKFGIVRDWLVVTNQGRLGQHIADQLLGSSSETLVDNARFQVAQGKLPRDPSAWAFVDVEALRDRGIGKELFERRSDNPVAELILGGLLSNLKHTPLATAAVELKQDHARLTLTSPHDVGWVGEAREFYFGPNGTGRAPALLMPEDTILALSTYRDLAGMWLHADDLFDQGVNDGFAQADSALSTLFAGKDFGEEVLGSLNPELQVVVKRQSFGDRLPQPAIKLPAFAGVWALREPAEMRDDFRRTFQSLMGFLNVIGAMNGQPQLDFFVEKRSDEQLLTSNYVAEGSDRESRQARINFNFSPAVALVGEQMILSSDSQLARELSEQVDGVAGEDVNTFARLNVGALHDVLDDNRDQLVAQNMLEEGHSKEEAEHEIDTLLQVVQFFRQASLRLDVKSDQLQLRVQLDFETE